MTKIDNGGHDDCVEDGDTIIEDIKSEPIFRPIKERIRNLEADVSELKDELSAFKHELSGLKHEMSSFKRAISRLTRQRYTVLAANAITRFVETLQSRISERAAKGDSSQSQLQLQSQSQSQLQSQRGYSTTEVERAAGWLYERKQEILGQFSQLDDSCLKLLKNFWKVKSEHDALARNTDYELAELVLDGLCDEQEAKVWRKVLEFIYSSPLEELASRRQSFNSSLIA